MRNTFKLLAIIVLLLAFAFSIAACGDSNDDDDSGNGVKTESLNGTWVFDQYNLKFDNGYWECWDYYSPYLKGTYSSEAENLTMTITHLNDRVVSDRLTDKNKWYSKDELLAEGGEYYDKCFIPAKGTYTIKGNTLTISKEIVFGENFQYYSVSGTYFRNKSTIIYDDDGGEIDPALNGRWISDSFSDDLILNNGSWEMVYNIPTWKGTYTTNNGCMTMRWTHYYGPFHGWDDGMEKVEWVEYNVSIDPYKGPYSVNGNKLTTRSGFYVITYTKK